MNKDIELTNHSTKTIENRTTQKEEREMKKSLYPPPVLMSRAGFRCPKCSHEEDCPEGDSHDPSHEPKQKDCPKCKIPMHYHFPTPARHGGPEILDLEKKY